MYQSGGGPPPTGPPPPRAGRTDLTFSLLHELVHPTEGQVHLQSAPHGALRGEQSPVQYQRRTERLRRESQRYRETFNGRAHGPHPANQHPGAEDVQPGQPRRLLPPTLPTSASGTADAAAAAADAADG